MAESVQWIFAVMYDSGAWFLRVIMSCALCVACNQWKSKNIAFFFLQFIIKLLLYSVFVMCRIFKVKETWLFWISWKSHPIDVYYSCFMLSSFQALNPVFILIMIPIFETIIYPLLRKCNLLVRYGKELLFLYTSMY